jgi:predicted amidohydrolase
VIGPDGALLAQVPYGAPGVAVADVDPARADGLMARRFAPERNRREYPVLGTGT